MGEQQWTACLKDGWSFLEGFSVHVVMCGKPDNTGSSSCVALRSIVRSLPTLFSIDFPWNSWSLWVARTPNAGSEMPKVQAGASWNLKKISVLIKLVLTLHRPSFIIAGRFWTNYVNCQRVVNKNIISYYCDVQDVLCQMIYTFEETSQPQKQIFSTVSGHSESKSISLHISNEMLHPNVSTYLHEIFVVSTAARGKNVLFSRKKKDR